MAYQAFKDNYFKNMIRTAKTSQVSYAFGSGKAGGETCFVLDDALDPAQLFAKVKSEKGAKAGGFGLCRAQGSALLLTPAKKFPGLKKELMALAKAQAWPVKKVKVVGEDEAEEEESDASVEEGAEPSGTAAPGSRPATPPAASPTRAETAGKEVPGGELAGTDDAGENSPRALARKAESILKGVQVWEKTTQAVTRSLRKLQKAVLDLRDPRSAPIIRSLEEILRQLDTVDEEAEAAAKAARAGDAAGFDRARDTLVAKLDRMMSRVQSDELIRDADENPLVEVRIGDTLGKSIQAILRVLK